MTAWKGVPYLFDMNELLNKHISVVVEKVPQIVIEPSFSWDVALSGFLAGCVPAAIAWFALKNSKVDNEKNRAATLEATKRAVYGQTLSDRFRKNTDTVTTLVAHFMGYCTKLLLSMEQESGSFRYHENRLDLVLIRNKLAILLEQEYVIIDNKTGSISSNLNYHCGNALLEQVEQLLTLTELYKEQNEEIKAGILCNLDQDIIKKTDIERKVDYLALTTRGYVKYMANKLDENLK